jgi:hypothetical protein
MRSGSSANEVAGGNMAKNITSSRKAKKEWTERNGMGGILYWTWMTKTPLRTGLRRSIVPVSLSVFTQFPDRF